jgi:hypothetical protein
MKRIFKSLLLISSVALIFSCTDDSLDPVKFKEIKKGTILALRGTQLDNIYFEGICGAEIFANDLARVPKFEFEAEFLSEDKSSLASVDVFALKKTKSGSTTTVEKVLLVNVPSSAFATGDYPGPSAKVSINVSDIITKIGSPSSAVLLDLYANGIDIHSDLNLTDGTKVLSDQIVAAGLFQSDQFYPAQILSICVSDVDDIRPVAETSQRGQVSGKTRPVRPLKAGAKDTVDFVFDQDLSVAPTITMTPPAGVTSGTLSAVTKVSASKYYVVFTADAAANYTGNVTISSTGGKTADGLLQIDKSHSLAMDNLAPQAISFSTGTRMGKGGSVTITATFNERLGTAPKISSVAGSIDPKVDLITNVSMTLSADGLTATYVYEYKDTGNDAVHGYLNVNVTTAGADVATLPTATSAFTDNLTIDLGTPPAPVLTKDVTQYDWGTSIKWSATETAGAGNPGGAVAGTIYFMACTSGKPGPTAFGFASDGSPSWTMPDDPASTADPKAKVAIRQTGSLTTANSSVPGVGESGPVYSAFTANGTLDVYAVFVGSTGNTSAVTATPQLTAVVMQ